MTNPKNWQIVAAVLAIKIVFRAIDVGIVIWSVNTLVGKQLIDCDLWKIIAASFLVGMFKSTGKKEGDE